MTDSERISLYQTQPHPCGYLPERDAQSIFVDPNRHVDRHTLTYLAELGFRRSGKFIYQPSCQQCHACISARVPVADFIQNRGQRRVMRRNTDLTVSYTPPEFNEETYLLFERYIEERHADGDMYPPTRAMFKGFLVESLADSKDSRFIEFRLQERLVAVAVIDLLDNAYSAIYTYFDPDQASRSLGSYCILWQIEHAREVELEFLYLGYWIKECSKMSYKINYRPVELLVNRRWTRLK